MSNYHLESGAAHDASALAVNQGGEADGVLAGAVGGPHDGRDDVVEGVDLVVVNHGAVMLERNGVERTFVFVSVSSRKLHGTEFVESIVWKAHLIGNLSRVERVEAGQPVAAVAEGEVGGRVHVGLRGEQVVGVLEHAAEHEARPRPHLLRDARQQVGGRHLPRPVGAAGVQPAVRVLLPRLGVAAVAAAAAARRAHLVP